MADFTVEMTGAVLATWSDPSAVDGTRPSRLNTHPQHPHRRRTAVVGDEITVTATPNGGAAGALDAALGGRLFLGWLVEQPSGGSIAVSSPPGQSSVLTFTPELPGHYTLVMRRAGGGGIFLHLDVTEAP